MLTWLDHRRCRMSKPTARRALEPVAGWPVGVVRKIVACYWAKPACSIKSASRRATRAKASSTWPPMSCLGRREADAPTPGRSVRRPGHGESRQLYGLGVAHYSAMAESAQKADLQRYLEAGREALLGRLTGLSERDVRRPMVPTGTNSL